MTTNGKEHALDYLLQEESQTELLEGHENAGYENDRNRITRQLIREIRLNWARIVLRDRRYGIVTQPICSSDMQPNRLSGVQAQT